MGREVEVERLAGPPVGVSSWERLCPSDAWRAPVLRAIAAELDRPETSAEVERCEAEERYPLAVLDRLRALGLMALWADPAGSDAQAGTLRTAWHLCAVNAIVARRNTSVAVTVGVNTLAQLPATIGADPSQGAWLGERVRAGAFSSMLLTELDHGSNLLRNACRATRGALGLDGRFVALPDGLAAEVPDAVAAEATHYRLDGEKDLINGGIEHALLFVLARTRDARPGASPLAALGDHTLLVVERGPGVVALPRWRTLPAQAADISGVRFEGALVPRAQVLGGEGGGFKLIKKTLVASRGGIAALASGTASRALDLARRYAARRDVYGAPIATLAAIGDHLLRAAALDRLVAALSLQAAASLNALGLGATYHTAIAKVTGCALAEEAVREGTRVLGGRALLRELPYERVLRDVLLFGVFDGTSHVMLDEVQLRLDYEVHRWSQVAPGSRAPDTLTELRRVLTAPPAPARDVLRRPGPPWIPPLPEHLRALVALHDDGLDALPLLADALYGAVRALRDGGVWTADQGMRFAAAEALGELEALAAVLALGCPARRAALGLPPLASSGWLDEARLNRFTVGFITSRIAARVQTLVAGAGLREASPFSVVERGGLEGVERDVLKRHAEVRRALLSEVAAYRE